MTDRELVLKALTDTRRMDGTLDTLAITRSLMDSYIILGDEERWGEGCVMSALDEAPLDASESDLVDAIARHLGIKEVAA